MNSNDSHLPNMSLKSHQTNSNNAKLSKISNDMKTHLPSISMKSTNQISSTSPPPPLSTKSKHPGEGFNWLEHHPIEKNEKLPSIGHFKYSNTIDNDKNISFIQDLFEYNREVEPNQSSQAPTLPPPPPFAIRNQENNYKLDFQPKRNNKAVRRKHEIEYPWALTYRVFIDLIYLFILNQLFIK